MTIHLIGGGNWRHKSKYSRVTFNLCWSENSKFENKVGFSRIASADMTPFAPVNLRLSWISWKHLTFPFEMTGILSCSLYIF